MIELKSVKVKKIIFYNNQSSWGVFTIESPKEDNSKLRYNSDVIVAGNFEGIYEDCILTLSAEEVTHPRYGKQLQLKQYKILEDTSSKESIINFLTKSSISGIHKILAERIYNEFKENSIYVVLHETEKLKTIKGIGKKTYEVVCKSVSTYFDMEELLNYCAEIGLSKYSLVIQLYKEFGKEAVNMIKENPYQLLMQSESISFNQIDEIALKSGIKPDDDNRLMYGLLYVLTRESIMKGSTGCEDLQLKQCFLKTLGLQNGQLYRFALAKLLDDKKIITDNDGNVFLTSFYDAEKSIATKLLTINKELPYNFGAKVVEEELNSFPFSLNDDQKKAIHSCLTHQFSVITALAGAGKSTISKAIVNILSRHHNYVVLLAPTAKAARRLSECTGFPASTIHKFLNIVNSTLESSKEVEVPRNATILVDEASMVDVRLFSKILNVIQSDTRVILVGDTHQLPSVQAGNLLEDIINSGAFNICYLRDITRQAEGSNIIKYSNMINDGAFIPQTLKTQDLMCLSLDNTQKDLALKTLIKSYKANVETYGLLNTQVICAYKGGLLGVNSLNKELKDIINPAKEKDESEIFSFQVGDKVRQTVNDYKQDVFNGETGIVVDILEATDENNKEDTDILVVDYGDRCVTYDKCTVNQLVLSYASTVHSVQGSEYDCVYVILDNEISNILLIRKIVYTAITRAKKKCYIINIDGCVNIAISNDHYKERLTRLKELVEELQVYA